MADKQAVFVVRGDGSVIASKNNTSGWFAGNPLNAALKPGDSIVVPEKAPKIGTRNWTHGHAGGADCHLGRAGDCLYQAVVGESLRKWIRVMVACAWTGVSLIIGCPAFAAASPQQTEPATGQAGNPPEGPGTGSQQQESREKRPQREERQDKVGRQVRWRKRRFDRLLPESEEAS